MYFIGSGLIKIKLPKDLSVLDAAGKAASGRAKRKADAIGNLYRIGNHFGESCLNSLSGVRQETSEARTLAELYLLHKVDLDMICGYMNSGDRAKFREGLLARNGNVRHTFEGDEEEEEKEMKLQLEREAGRRTNRGTLGAGGGSSPGMVARNRKPRNSLEDAANERANPYQQKAIRRKTLGLSKKPTDLVRLRSFSAEASKEAIKGGGAGEASEAASEASHWRWHSM